MTTSEPTVITHIQPFLVVEVFLSVLSAINRGSDTILPRYTAYPFRTQPRDVPSSQPRRAETLQTAEASQRARKPVSKQTKKGEEKELDQNASCVHDLFIDVCSCCNPKIFCPRNMGSNVNDGGSRVLDGDSRSILTEKSSRSNGLTDVRSWKSSFRRGGSTHEKRGNLESPDDGPRTPARQFGYFSPTLEDVVYSSDLNSLVNSHESVRKLMETGEQEDVWWLDVTAPSTDDIEWLSRVFAIHPLTTEDIGIQETREKIELFGHYYFVSLRLSHPYRRAGTKTGAPGSSILNQYALVFKGGILSVTFGPSPHAGHVRNRIMEHKSHLALTSDWICYALIDDIVDGFAPSIHQIQQGIETMEDSFAITRPDDIGLVLQQIYKCRKEITRIRHLLNDKTDVIKSFARRCDERCFITPSCEVVVYLTDIQDHVLTMISNLAHLEQMLSGSQTKYVEQLSMDNNRTRNRTLETLGKLTVLGTMFIPMQTIIGSFGMNVHVPGEDDSGVGWWFGIIGGIASIVACCLVIAKLRRWI